MSNMRAMGMVVMAALLVVGCGKKDQGQPKDNAAPAANATAAAVDYTDLKLGTLETGDGKPSADTDTWPQFRGPNRDNIVADAKNLLRAWPAEGPKQLWKIEGLSIGYAGPAIFGGKVYFHDYDDVQKLWMVRCVSLADGKQIWRWSYKRYIGMNHGITRSIPVVDDKYVISLDPKCVLHCFDAATGKRLWAKDLVKEYGVAIPSWFNGQCPLDQGDRVVIAVAGPKVLMAAFDKATGKAIWETPNPNPGKFKLVHPSVMPMTLAGRKQYVWCVMDGPVGVDAADGKFLWHAPWEGKTAVAPSPLPLADGRIFMTSGYGVGSIMLQLEPQGQGYAPKTLYTLTDKQFNSECHTPILWQDHLFAIDNVGTIGKFTCLGLDGKIVWQHTPTKEGFGLGSFLLADGMFFVLEGDTGVLRLIEASTKEYKELASTDKVLSGGDVWAPMALANGKLVLRDANKMVCIEVGKP